MDRIVADVLARLGAAASPTLPDGDRVRRPGTEPLLDHVDHQRSRAASASREILAAAMEMAAQPAADREGVSAQAVKTAHLVSGRGFPVDEEWVRERTALSYDRGLHPDGRLNQTAAIAVAADRTAALGKLTVPTVVIHGSDDPLVSPVGGELTAKAIPGAQLVIIDGMGHDLTDGACPAVIEAIVTKRPPGDNPGLTERAADEMPLLLGTPG